MKNGLLQDLILLTDFTNLAQNEKIMWLALLIKTPVCLSWDIWHLSETHSTFFLVSMLLLQTSHNSSVEEIIYLNLQIPICEVEFLAKFIIPVDIMLLPFVNTLPRCLMLLT